MAESTTMSRTPATPPSAGTDDRSGSASLSFGRHLFDLASMKKRLPRPVFEAIQATINSGERLDTGLADVVAGAMKDWAVEHGATHFTHWFQPLTGATAEKHDAFLDVHQGPPIESFSGAQLIQAEPDASSFPSGGMRSTFEARGYTAWDPTSPAFLVFHEGGATLTIPSVFVSYTGVALDKKTPLLRSMREVSEAAVRALRLLGREATRVTPTLGAEQEYFLIRRDWFEQRPDLEVTGRTVIGATPPKGQQLEDNYFGTIDDRALEFMAEVEAEAWKLGIPIKTRHNEVAPHQYEAAPIFQPANVATDQNHMLMEIMRKVARRRGLVALFHEKPFAGVNGSGKHSNWSLSDDGGRNLLDPTENPQQNLEFLFFLVAVVKAVHRRARLLRSAIASSGNDHRLGANEAPPAIISVFLGDRLTEILEMIAEGKAVKGGADEVIETGLATLPAIKRDNTDRNRTSPFAFTGNKFEFRAVGSSQSLAMPMVYLNVAVAEALSAMSDRLEALLSEDKPRGEAILTIVREVYGDARAVVFNGNNYGDAWVEEAARRGLPNEIDTPAALEVLSDPEETAFLEERGVLTRPELEARRRIRLEKYCRMLKIEAIQMLRLAKTGAIPAGMQQQALMAEAVSRLEGLGLDGTSQRSELERYAGSVSGAVDGVNAIRRALAEVPGEEASADQARYLCDVLGPAMAQLREACDALERRTDAALWPFPTYHEMLFQ